MFPCAEAATSAACAADAAHTGAAAGGTHADCATSASMRSMHTKDEPNGTGEEYTSGRDAQASTNYSIPGNIVGRFAARLEIVSNVAIIVLAVIVAAVVLRNYVFTPR